MQCEQAGAMLSARLDGRLENGEVGLLQNHLNSCAACQADEMGLHRLDILFRAAPMARAPIHLRTRVLARLEQRDQRRRLVFGSLILVFGASALALLTVAPLLPGLLGMRGVVPTLAGGAPAALLHVASLAGTLARTWVLLAEAFAAPLAVMGLCGFATLLLLNGLWIGALCRKRATR